MGQREVQAWLENKRAISPRYYKVKDIKKGMRADGHTDAVCLRAGECCFKLALYGLIEWRGRGIWAHHKEFRGRVK